MRSKRASPPHQRGSRISDLWVRPNVSTGVVVIEATMQNWLDQSQSSVLQCVISPSSEGHAIDKIRLPIELKPGINRLKATFSFSGGVNFQFTEVPPSSWVELSHPTRTAPSAI
jgi:hypothetical protein